MKMYNYLYLFIFSLSILFTAAIQAAVPPRLNDTHKSCPAVVNIRHTNPTSAELDQVVRKIFLKKNFEEELVCFEG